MCECEGVFQKKAKCAGALRYEWKRAVAARINQHRDADGMHHE
jgi:hypothetical protein